MSKLSASLFALASILPITMQGETILTFEGLQDDEPILNYYNGGMGGLGSGPGPNYGITFTPDSLAIISNASGGQGNFDGNPSGITVAFFLTGSGDTMNVPAGFTTGFSFYYSAAFNPGTVNVYSGANGTGSLLTTLSLPQTPAGEGTGSCNNVDQFCPWIPFGVTFDGTATSVVFSGTANFIGFDDVTLGSATPGTASTTPEPADALLVAAGVGALLLAGRRHQKNGGNSRINRSAS